MDRLAACVSALVVILALFPQAAAGQSTPRIVTIRNAETGSLPRAYADPLLRAAGVSPSTARITLIQTSAINAFVATGNRMFTRSRGRGLRNAPGRANMTQQDRADARRQEGLPRR